LKIMFDGAGPLLNVLKAGNASIGFSFAVLNRREVHEYAQEDRKHMTAECSGRSVVHCDKSSFRVMWYLQMSVHNGDECGAVGSIDARSHSAKRRCGNS
jgi:hypothetical protein